MFTSKGKQGRRNKLLVPRALHISANDLASGRIASACRVVVVGRLGLSSSADRAIEGLNVRFLIDREHDDMAGDALDGTFTDADGFRHHGGGSMGRRGGKISLYEHHDTNITDPAYEPWMQMACYAGENLPYSERCKDQMEPRPAGGRFSSAGLNERYLTGRVPPRLGPA
jgi:hypothetical protein